MVTLSQPLKWHGGKGAFNGKLAKWIISLIPPHTHYVEPYFGGGAVLLNKDPEGVSEVVNDCNGDLMTFWKVLATTPDRMLRALWGTPFSEVEFDNAVKDLADSDDVRRATAFFIRCRQSRQGLQKDFATLSRNRTRGGMNEQVVLQCIGLLKRHGVELNGRKPREAPSAAAACVVSVGLG